MPILPGQTHDEVLEIGDSDVELVEDVERPSAPPPVPPRARRLSSPAIKLVEDDVADSVMAQLGAEVTRARASDRFRASVANVPAPPRPPAPQPRVPVPSPPRSRLPRVTAPPPRAPRVAIDAPPRDSLRAETIRSDAERSRMIPPPPPSYSDLEETIPYSAPSPYVLEAVAERPRKETPSVFVRGRESIAPDAAASSVAPVALSPRSNDGTVVILRRKPRTATWMAAAAVVGAVAAILALRIGLPAVFAELDREPVAARAVVAPLPAMTLPAAKPSAPAREVRFDDKEALVVATPPPAPPQAPVVHIVHPTPPPAPSQPPQPQASSPKPPKMPDGSLGLGARQETSSPPPKTEPPAPHASATAAPTAKPEPAASSTAAKKPLTPEQELAEAQLKASMR